MTTIDNSKKKEKRKQKTKNKKTKKKAKQSQNKQTSYVPKHDSPKLLGNKKKLILASVFILSVNL